MRRLIAGTLLVVLTGCAGVSSRTAAPASVLASIPVGGGPTLLAISRDGTRVFAASNDGLRIIDTASNTVLTTVRTDPLPTGLALTPDGARALVTNLFAIRLTVVDVPGAALGSPIELPLFRQRGGYGRIGVTPDGSTAWLANEVNTVMGIVNLRAGSASSTLMDMRPVDIALSADGRTAYVCGCKDFCVTGTIEVFEVGTQRQTATITVGPQPYRIALSPDGAHAYTANIGGPSLSIVNLASSIATATVPVGVEPTGLAVSRDGTRVYVASQVSGTVTVVDAASGTVRTTMPVGGAREIVVAPDASRAWVSTPHAVAVIPLPAA